MTVEEAAQAPEADREAPVAESLQGKYAYCIIESDEPRDFGPEGIGNRGDPVYTIHHGGLAAIVSDTPVIVYDPTRENALAHEHVNETVMKEFTVIPMSFSTVFSTADDVVEFLKDTSEALRDVLLKMKDKIEFGLKVNWDPEIVLKEIEQENEEIRRLRLVEEAMSERSGTYVRQVYDHLRSCAIASRHDKTIGDKMILNAAFLVERDAAVTFDQSVHEIALRFETLLRFNYSGPWPPYNFVNIRLKLERAGAVT